MFLRVAVKKGSYGREEEDISGESEFGKEFVRFSLLL
jgi:hypothetical protein